MRKRRDVKEGERRKAQAWVGGGRRRKRVKNRLGEEGRGSFWTEKTMVRGALLCLAEHRLFILRDVLCGEVECRGMLSTLLGQRDPRTGEAKHQGVSNSVLLGCVPTRDMLPAS